MIVDQSTNNNSIVLSHTYYPCSTRNSPLKPYFPKTKNSTVARRINANKSINHIGKSTKKENKHYYQFGPVISLWNHIFILGFQNLF
ncbi:hypothetical protein Peur_067121 [Populus x canadensis]